ncbi:hypothetical protein GCM10027168_50660 [Streptomyces capparidis]
MVSSGTGEGVRVRGTMMGAWHDRVKSAFVCRGFFDRIRPPRPGAGEGRGGSLRAVHGAIVHRPAPCGTPSPAALRHWGDPGPGGPRGAVAPGDHPPPRRGADRVARAITGQPGGLGGTARVRRPS